MDQFVIGIVISLPLLWGIPESELATTSTLIAAYITIALFVLMTAYWTLSEWLAGGQSIGKMIMRIRTVPHDRAGNAGISFFQALARSVPKSISLILFLDCLPLVLPKKRHKEPGCRVSDTAFGTRVVKWSANKV